MLEVGDSNTDIFYFAATLFRDLQTANICASIIFLIPNQLEMYNNFAGI